MVKFNDGDGTYIVNYNTYEDGYSITNFINYYNNINKGLFELGSYPDTILDAIRFSLKDVKTGLRFDGMISRQALLSESYPGMMIEESVKAAEIQLKYDAETENIEREIKFDTRYGHYTSERVLVFAPTSIEKEYCLEEYLGAYHAQTYENKELLLIDNSCGPYHYKDLSRRSDTGTVLRCERRGTLFDTIDECWRMALDYAKAHKIRYIMSIESDVLVPEDMIHYSLDTMYEKNVSIVSHAVPSRIGGSDQGFALACTLLDSEVMFGEDKWGDSSGAHFENQIYLRADHNGNGSYRADELTDYILHIEYPDVYREMTKAKWGEDSGIVL